MIDTVDFSRDGVSCFEAGGKESFVKATVFQLVDFG